MAILSLISLFGLSLGHWLRLFLIGTGALLRGTPLTLVLDVTLLPAILLALFASLATTPQVVLKHPVATTVLVSSHLKDLCQRASADPIVFIYGLDTRPLIVGVMKFNRTGPCL